MAVVAVAAAQPAVHSRLSTIYRGDDFFTLAPAYQALLALLSICLIAGLLIGFGRVSRQISRWSTQAFWRAIADILFRTTSYGALLMLSPQLYYSFYRLIIPGLPNQWVIRIPEVTPLLNLISFNGTTRIADHLAAALFWALILLAVHAQIRNTPALAITYIAILIFCAAFRAHLA